MWTVGGTVTVETSGAAHTPGVLNDALVTFGPGAAVVGGVVGAGFVVVGAGFVVVGAGFVVVGAGFVVVGAGFVVVGALDADGSVVSAADVVVPPSLVATADSLVAAPESAVSVRDEVELHAATVTSERVTSAAASELRSVCGIAPA